MYIYLHIHIYMHAHIDIYIFRYNEGCICIYLAELVVLRDEARVGVFQRNVLRGAPRQLHLKGKTQRQKGRT